MQGKPEDLVCVVARQAGTASAFLPVLKELDARSHGRVVLFAYAAADAVFRKDGWVPDHAIESFEQAKPYLEQLNNVYRKSVMLSGTSRQSEDDAAWWGWASSRDIPVMAFVDQWVCIDERFPVAHGKRIFPDQVAVVDAVAGAKVAELGCPPERILMTGTPLVDHLRSPGVDRIAELRREWAAKYEKIVAFACGNELEAFPAVADALCQAVSVVRHEGIEATLLFKRHPYHVQHGWVPPLPDICVKAGGVRVVDADRLEVLHAADVIVGTESMLLYESAIIGRCAICYWPFGGALPELAHAVSGIAVARNVDELIVLLRNNLCDRLDGPKQQIAIASDRGMAHVFVDALFKMAGGN